MLNYFTIQKDGSVTEALEDEQQKSEVFEFFHRERNPVAGSCLVLNVLDAGLQTMEFKRDEDEVLVRPYMPSVLRVNSEGLLVRLILNLEQIDPDSKKLLIRLELNMDGNL